MSNTPESIKPIDTGGWAFPRQAILDLETDEEVRFGSVGMTLLDWFAGKALPCVLAACRDDMKAVVARAVNGLSMDQVYELMQTPEFKALDEESNKRCAKIIYDLAELLIAEKRRREGGQA